MFCIKTNPYHGVGSFENELGGFSSIFKDVWRRRNQKNIEMITAFLFIQTSKFKENVTGINLKWEITDESPYRAGKLCIRPQNLTH